MKTENKNERTYWVIKKMFSVLAYRCKEKGFYTDDFKSAYRFNSLKEAFKEFVSGDAIEEITEPIYKEGNILATNSGNVFIFDKYDNIKDNVYDKAFLWYHGGFCIEDTPIGFFNCISGFATESQKQRLFDALEKEGKIWNAEKKIVEDISKPGSISFSVELNQKSVDRLMGETEKMCERLLDSKRKAEELFKKMQNEPRETYFEMDVWKKYLDKNYDIYSIEHPRPSLNFDGSMTPSSDLIVTYKPRRK